jgi:hypothetical protein
MFSMVIDLLLAHSIVQMVFMFAFFRVMAGMLSTVRCVCEPPSPRVVIRVPAFATDVTVPKTVLSDGVLSVMIGSGKNPGEAEGGETNFGSHR